jgi:DNA-binding NtrC family response regulator
MGIPPPDRKIAVVLIVEDEPLIRMSAVDLFEEAGFITFEAPNADEALVMLGQHPDITILFTDVDMPGTMDGLDLARKVSESDPGIHLIVGSGHRSVAPADLPHGALFFPKPYDLPRLTAAIQRLV